MSKSLEERLETLNSEFQAYILKNDANIAALQIAVKIMLIESQYLSKRSNKKLKENLKQAFSEEVDLDESFRKAVFESIDFLFPDELIFGDFSS